MRKGVAFTTDDDDDDDDYENVSGMNTAPSVPVRAKKNSTAMTDDLALKCLDMPVKKAPSVWTTATYSCTGPETKKSFQPPPIGLDFSSPAVNEAFSDCQDSNDCKKHNTQSRLVLILAIVLTVVILIGAAMSSVILIHYVRLTAELSEIKQNVSEVQKMFTKEQNSLRGDIKQVNTVLASQVQDFDKKEHESLKLEMRGINKTLVMEQNRQNEEIITIKNKLCDLCPDGWILLDGCCYFVSTTTLSWDNAKNDCRQRGSAFLILTGSNQMDALNPLIGSKRFWIGLRKEGNNWKWVDGSRIIYSNWGENEPNNVGGYENCAEIISGKWNDLDCSNKKDYICKRTCC